MLRRSLFIWLMIARSLLFLNFGMAIAVRMPMITTTMSSSMSVKPLLEPLVIDGRFGIGLPLLSQKLGVVVPEKRGGDRRPPPLGSSSYAQAYQQAGAPSCTTAAFGAAWLPPNTPQVFAVLKLAFVMVAE